MICTDSPEPLLLVYKVWIQMKAQTKVQTSCCSEYFSMDIINRDIWVIGEKVPKSCKTDHRKFSVFQTQIVDTQKKIFKYSQHMSILREIQ